MTKLGKFAAACAVVVCVSSAMGADWYVAKTGSDEAAGTVEAPFASISSALARAVDGDTVHVSAGTYDAMQPTVVGDCAYLGVVTNAVTVEGDGEATTVLKGVFGGAKYACGFRLDHAKAVVRNLALTHCYTMNSSAPHTEELGVALHVLKGRAEQCRIFNNYAYENGSSYGMDSPIVYLAGAEAVLSSSIVTNNGMSAWGRFSAVYSKNAFVTNTLVKGNWTDDAISNDNHAGGITIKGGLVSDCRIIGNYIGTGNNSKAVPVGGVRILGGAVIERCYIASNRNHRTFNDYTAGGLYATGDCTIRNCIFEGNTASQGSFAAGGAQIRSADAKLYHCTFVNNTGNAVGGFCLSAGTAIGNISHGNTGVIGHVDVYKTGGSLGYSCFSDAAEGDPDGNFNADPRFTNPAAPYEPQSSKVRDAVRNGTNLVVDDYNGKLRPIYGEAGTDFPDMGAIECEKSDAAVTIELKPLSAAPAGGSFSPVAEIDPADTPLASVDWAFVAKDGTRIERKDAGLAPTFSGFTAGVYDIVIMVTPQGGQPVSETFVGGLRVKSTVCYVATDGGDEYPYDTPANAARNLKDAVDAVCADGDTIGTVRILDGNYPEMSNVEQGQCYYMVYVTTPVAIVGNNDDPTAVHLHFSVSDHDGGGIYLAHPKASLSGVMLSGSLSKGQISTSRLTASAINVEEGATASNCVVTGIAYSQSKWTQPFVTMTEGLIRNLVVTNNYLGSGQNASQGGWAYNEFGIRMTGGTLDGCLIDGLVSDEINSSTVVGLGLYGGVARNVIVRNSSCKWSSSGSIGDTVMGIRVSGATTVLENSVVSNCFNRVAKSHATFAGIRQEGGTVRNCLVANCGASEASLETAGAGLDLRNGTACNVTVVGCEATGSGFAGLRLAGGTLINTIVWGGISHDGAVIVRRGSGTDSHCRFDVDPLFRNSSAGDYRLRPISPCRNAGDDSVWTNLDIAHDLGGLPRRHGRHVDLGCYECQDEAGLVILLW